MEHEAGVVQEQRLHLLEAAERQPVAFPDSAALPDETCGVRRGVVADYGPLFGAHVKSGQFAVQSTQFRRRFDSRRSNDDRCSDGNMHVGRERIVVACTDISTSVVGYSTGK